MIRLAGCVITDEKGRVLLLHRNNGKHSQWEIPGGKIDDGESAKQAAKREIKEELGVDVAIQEKIGEKEFQMDGKDFHYTWFTAKITDGKPKIAEPETFDNLKYFPPGQMRQIYDELSLNTQNFLNAQGGGNLRPA
ncbi:MAG TPA: NUDIX hydrolase [Candidatus Nitrosopolaris sp.]|nr:NUDIX hydrolase [Candidatus Nitrosopolaris sp.]